MVETIICLSQKMCNTKKLLKKVINGIVYSKICSLLIFLTMRSEFTSFFSSSSTRNLKCVLVIGSVIEGLDVTNCSKSHFLCCDFSILQSRFNIKRIDHTYVFYFCHMIKLQKDCLELNLTILWHYIDTIF